MPAIQEVVTSSAVGHDEVDSMVNATIPGVELNQTYEEFQITDQEYLLLDTKFGDLVHYAAWQLLKKNAKNNHTDELEDIAQDLRMAVIRAGVYYKRQVFIEECFKKADEYVKDEFTQDVVRELKKLWMNRTRHGANRRKYGLHQERVLETIVKKFVPADKRPSKSAPLSLDTTFVTYCKAITWNCQKSMGKKITREKSWRSGLASLSEYEYLSSSA